MKRQTAVNWLHIEFQKRFTKETSEMYNNNQLAYEDMILKAKAMEKEQIIDSRTTSPTTSGDVMLDREEAEQYYSQTFEP